YYPPRFTWGFHARYNPWLSRWSFGASYSSGFLRVGTRWRSGSQVAPSSARSKWFGPGGYRRPLVAQDMTLLRTRPGRTRPRVSDGLPANLYSRTENVARVDRSADRIRIRSIAPRRSRPEVGPRRDDPAVEHRAPQRDNPPERPAPPAERPAPPAERPTPPSEQPTPGDLEKEYRARERSDHGDNSDAPQTERPAAR